MRRARMMNAYVPFEPLRNKTGQTPVHFFFFSPLSPLFHSFRSGGRFNTVWELVQTEMRNVWDSPPTPSPPQLFGAAGRRRRRSDFVGARRLLFRPQLHRSGDHGVPGVPAVQLVARLAVLLRGQLVLRLPRQRLRLPQRLVCGAAAPTVLLCPQCVLCRRLEPFQMFTDPQAICSATCAPPSNGALRVTVPWHWLQHHQLPRHADRCHGPVRQQFALALERPLRGVRGPQPHHHERVLGLQLFRPKRFDDNGDARRVSTGRCG